MKSLPLLFACEDCATVFAYPPDWAKEFCPNDGHRLALVGTMHATPTVAIMAAVLVARSGGNGGVYSHEEIAREAWELYGAIVDLASDYSK